jgi:hypothetical protein
MQLLVGVGPGQVLKEGQELVMTMPLLALSGDLAGGDLQRREQGARRSRESTAVSPSGGADATALVSLRGLRRLGNVGRSRRGMSGLQGRLTLTFDRRVRQRHHEGNPIELDAASMSSDIDDKTVIRVR